MIYPVQVAATSSTPIVINNTFNPLLSKLNLIQYGILMLQVILFLCNLANQLVTFAHNTFNSVFALAVGALEEVPGQQALS